MNTTFINNLLLEQLNINKKIKEITQNTNFNDDINEEFIKEIPDNITYKEIKVDKIIEELQGLNFNINIDKTENNINNKINKKITTEFKNEIINNEIIKNKINNEK
ncbi:hypothetical protein PIROE2DRAFT_12103 [Piromyces sp. E2]|nr:hypothetical protein PIROE2DRAFT_12103 [Piromyces sp. E2]|eukprot:OUM61800.1 hypothetical protein PIROE2DRAFT_12103 [Piromyces sp. E2]